MLGTYPSPRICGISCFPCAWLRGVWLSAQIPGPTTLIQKRLYPSNGRWAAHYETSKTKNKKNWILDKQMFPQAPEGFTRLIITNMKLELIFYKLLSPSSYISFNFHFIPSFFSTCFWSSILYYREVSSGMQEASHRQPDEKVCWSRKKIIKK